MPLQTASSEGYSFYWTAEERGKSARRTAEWTVPQLERFGIVPPARVLSVGCGNGVDVLTLRDKGYVSFGVDTQFSGYPGQSFATASGSQLPFANGHFDAVVSLEVIEHVDLDGGGSRRRFAEDLQRVTRAGGLIVIATPNRYFPIDEHGDPIRVHSPFERDTLSFGELCGLFSECKPHTLNPAKYFAFRRFAQLAGEWCPTVLEGVSNFLGSRPLHASPLNPHLYVGFLKS
jgi:SAM-dependent methyltransferase